MITNGERGQIRQVLSTPQWQTVERMAEILCQSIKDSPVVKDTEWDTLRTALLNEGEVRGIRRFIQELYTQAVITAHESS